MYINHINYPLLHKIHWTEHRIYILELQRVGILYFGLIFILDMRGVLVEDLLYETENHAAHHTIYRNTKESTKQQQIAHKWTHFQY